MFFAQLTTSDTYYKIDLAGYTHLLVINDDTVNNLDFSFNSSATHGIVFKNEGIEFQHLNERTIFVKSASLGNPVAVRVFAWGNPGIIYGTHLKLISTRKPYTPKFSKRD